MESIYSGNVTRWEKNGTVVIWDCNLQCYTVYKSDKVIAVKYKFSDIAS